MLIIVFLHLDNLPIRTSKINPMKTYPSEIIVSCHFVRRFTSTVLNSGILDNYGNQGVTIDDRLPDKDRILAINRFQNTITIVPAGSTG